MIMGRPFQPLSAIEPCETGCGELVQARHYEGAERPKVFTIRDGQAVPGGHAILCTGRAENHDLLIARARRERPVR